MQKANAETALAFHNLPNAIESDFPQRARAGMVAKSEAYVILDLVYASGKYFFRIKKYLELYVRTCEGKFSHCVSTSHTDDLLFFLKERKYIVVVRNCENVSGILDHD